MFSRIKVNTLWEGLLITQPINRLQHDNALYIFLGSKPLARDSSEKSNAPYLNERSLPGGGRGVLPIMGHTGRLHPKGVAFSGFRYIKG